MRRFILISSAALSMLAVGCASPQSVCETGVKNACAKVFECSEESVKSSDAFKAIYGASAAECETKMMTAAKCSEKKEFNEMCTDGKEYDLGKASECSDAVKAQSCADFNDATKRPAACAEVCK
ncbi:MAG TPA: hypothetical protein VLQ93_00170 [Myxococcaceae bacterium]|nr:hypothetical protein [Myxococcaceae bacterium]